MSARIAPYAAFLRASFLKMLAYRLRYFTGVLSYLIYVSTYYFLWRSVYAHRAEGATLGGSAPNGDGKKRSSRMTAGGRPGRLARGGADPRAERRRSSCGATAWSPSSGCYARSTPTA